MKFKILKSNKIVQFSVKKINYNPLFCASICISFNLFIEQLEKGWSNHSKRSREHLIAFKHTFCLVLKYISGHHFTI